MKKNRILVLVTVLSLAISSCGKPKPDTDNAEILTELNNNAVYKNYTAKCINTDFDIVSGVYNDEIYGIDYSTYYSVFYADTLAPDIPEKFPSDLAGIFYLKEHNDKIYVYGYNQDNCKIYTFTSDMSAYTEIPVNVVHCTSIAPFDDGRIFVSILDGYKSCLRIYSADGEILNTVYPDFMNTGYTPWINDSIVMNDNLIVLSVKEAAGQRIIAFDNNLEYAGEISSDENILENVKFSDVGDAVYICDTSLDDNNADFYRLNSDMSPLEYITSVTDADYTINGSGIYDFGYISKNDLYGFNVSESSSTLICENVTPNFIISASDGLKYICSDNKHSQRLAKSGSPENELVYELVNSDLLNYERFSYNGHFQALKYEDRKYSVYDIALDSGKTDIIQLNMDDSLYVNDILVSNSNIYVYLIDEFDCCYIRIFDKNGNQINEYSSENRITDFSVMNDGGLFIIENDEISDSYKYAVLNPDGNAPVSLEADMIPEDEILTVCFPSNEDNVVYLMSENYIYSGEIKGTELVVSVLVPLDAVNQSLDSGIYDFFYDNGNMYIISGNEIYQLTEEIAESESEDVQKTENILNIAYINCFPDDWIKEKFESEHPEYTVNCIMYDSSKEDFTDELNLSLISDNSPDMIVMRDEEFSDYTITRDNNKGIYTDLYMIISEDEELERSDFRDSVLTAMEFQGRLFQISPYFTVKTVLAKESDVNVRENWTTEQFTEYLNNHSDSAFFRNDRDIVSKTALNLLAFYDYDYKKCVFDSDKFRNLIETVQIFPESADIIPDFSLLDIELYNYNQINEAENVYFKGEKSINTGYPDTEGNGAMIIPDMQFSILEDSKNKNAAWDVIKYYLSEEYFDNNYSEIQKFPVMNCLGEKLESITQNITDESGYLTLKAYDFMKNPVKLSAPDNVYTQAVDDIIDNASVVYRYDFRIEGIFLDEYSEYIEGEQTISEMSADIQKKVEIYLGERG